MCCILHHVLHLLNIRFCKVVSDDKVKDMIKTLVAWKTAVQHHLEGLDKYTTKLAIFLE